ncbi:MAG: cell division protein FtsQ/DivIB [Pseudonocardiaceae bacterium]
MNAARPRPRPPLRGFPQRNHPQRGRRRAIGLAAIGALVGALTWMLLGSSLLDARSVQVIGTTELSADEVRTAAAVPLGVSVLQLDTGEIEARVAAVPRVAGVQVGSTFSGTVRITVTERTPIAVRSAPDGVHLIDVTGTDYATIAEAPPGLPELEVARTAPDDPATLAAITVLIGLSPPLRNQVLSVTANSPADVVLRLADDREVRWGGVESADRKAATLTALLTQPGQIYDISSPDLPTIS